MLLPEIEVLGGMGINDKVHVDQSGNILNYKSHHL
jgi:hypothetical protein